MTWKWVNYDRIIIFGRWTITFMQRKINQTLFDINLLNNLHLHFLFSLCLCVPEEQWGENLTVNTFTLIYGPVPQPAACSMCYRLQVIHTSYMLCQCPSRSLSVCCSTHNTVPAALPAYTKPLNNSIWPPGPRLRRLTVCKCCGWTDECVCVCAGSSRTDALKSCSRIMRVRK